jgi:Fic family protein
MPLYSRPSQFEPLLPSRGLERLVARSREVLDASLELKRSLHPASLAPLRELVRAMNSYYSNRIEGQGTHPLNIERALRQDFSAKPETAQRQRIAVAHIAAERELEASMQGEGLAPQDVIAGGFLAKAHAALYRRLDAADRTTKDGLVIEPGVLRDHEVKVGLHEAPAFSAVPAFLARMDEVYSKAASRDTSLVAIAAAHHRAAWVHPFGDGNGRAVRLQSHCALLPSSGGLWSVSRAFARNRDDYYRHLAEADQPRQGDLDGRGNLSEKSLVAWCDFFIAVCEDQVRFMSEMLDLDKLQARINALVAARAAQPATWLHYRPELSLALRHVLAAGPVSRGEFKQMTGLADRTAQRSLNRLVSDGLLRSEGAKGAVSIAFSLDSLNILFPNLYPEAASANLEP